MSNDQGDALWDSWVKKSKEDKEKRLIIEKRNLEANLPRSDKAFAEVLYEWEDPVDAHNTVLFHLAFLNDPKATYVDEDGYILLDENEKIPFIEYVLNDYKEIITIKGLKEFVEELLFGHTFELEKDLNVGDTEECDYPDEDAFLEAIDYEKLIKIIKQCWERACLSEEEYFKILVK